MDRLHNEKARFGEENMTAAGTVRKIGVLFALMLAGFIVMAVSVSLGEVELNQLTLIGLPIITLLIVIFVCFLPSSSPTLAPIYALMEGMVLGLVVGLNNYVFEAFLITIVIFLTLLILYRTRIIRVTNGFMKLTFGLTIGVVLFYLLEWLLVALHITSGDTIFGNGPIGWILALFCLFVAVSNLLIDFRMIEDGANQNLPKYMEWYFGMGLMISIVWVYIEVLRMLQILGSRD